MRIPKFEAQTEWNIPTEFPDLRSKTVRKVPTVVGGTRYAPGKRKVKLSRSELEMASSFKT